MSQHVVFYQIGVNLPITPQEPLPALPDIPKGSVVVIDGRAPIWRYGMAFHRLHASPAAVVAVYDPRLGAVVVASHKPGLSEGDILDVEPPAQPHDNPSYLSPPGSPTDV